VTGNEFNETSGGGGLSHLDADGAARMVDVSGKVATLREAVAEGFVWMKAGTRAVLLASNGPKGEVLGPARIAGIMAAKRTGELIPLCHPLPVEEVAVAFEVVDSAGGNAELTTEARRHGEIAELVALRIEARARVTAKTGVEMEALVAVSVAGLTIIDMLKAIDPAMLLSGVRVVSKRGGKSDYRAT
jgi:cyclic pyranopterin phosphate synthase